MRFSNGFFGENEATLGTLRFSAMRREVFKENADGTPSDVVKERTYDLKSDKQGRMIQVSVSATHIGNGTYYGTISYDVKSG